jgi:hypothetical protein
MYGGAAGGGKSDALLMGALAHVEQAEYSALILRKTYTDLSMPRAIMDRAADWLRSTAAKWHEAEKTWRFPSGARLTFGYLESEKDKYRYQSAEFQFIGFDELTQFPESQYTYLLSRLRRAAGSSIPVAMRSATNPGGIGHDWVKSRFVDAKTARGAFVPAKLSDNEYVDRDQYEIALDLLDSTTRMQLKNGIWVRDTGGLIYHYSPELNSVKELPDKIEWQYVWIADFGSSEKSPTTAVGVLAYSPLSPFVYLVESSKHPGWTVSDVATRYKADELRFGGFDHVLGDQGGLGGGYLKELVDRHNIPIHGVEKKNKLGYRKLMNDDLTHGRLLVIDEANTDWIEETNTLCWNDKGTDAQPGQADHATDMALYGWREAKHWQHEAEEKPKTVEQKVDETWERMRQKIEANKLKRPLRITRA